jgi:hypothetical protein
VGPLHSRHPDRPVSGALVRAVFGGAGDSPHVRDLRHRFWLIRSILVRPMVERAIERGQLPAGTMAEEVIKHVSAPSTTGSSSSTSRSPRKPPA